MEICNTIAQLKQALGTLPKNYKRALVPSMGALHQGHISLVKKAMESTGNVIVSIFVNPTQFNNPDDLNKYPRTAEADCRILEEAGAAVVFIPSQAEIYPSPDNRIFDFDGLDLTGEGPRRPGHFNGVVQVVTRLFDIVEPDIAFFGEKDFQQLAIIRHMVKKLGYKIEITGCETLRESDGLAMSSRNTLLSSEHRAAASNIYRSLNKAKILDKYSPKELAGIIKKEIDSSPLLRCEYVEIVDSRNLRIIESWDDAVNIRVCTAVYASDVRLIDNIKLR